MLGSLMLRAKENYVPHRATQEILAARILEGFRFFSKGLGSGYVRYALVLGIRARAKATTGTEA